MVANRVEDLRAWQLAYDFKLSIYELIKQGGIPRDTEIGRQLKESAASAVSQIEEGFARFYPKDFGRMAVGGKASLLECCGHVRDAIDRGLITQDTTADTRRLAAEALKELVGLIDYLQSPEAEENARRIKERRAKRRRERKNREHRTENPEQGTENP